MLSAMERPFARTPAGHAQPLALLPRLSASLLTGLLAVCVPGAAIAQATEATPPAAVSCCIVPAGTRVDLQVIDTVNSRTAKRGDRVRIRLSAPLTTNGMLVLPAGLDGEAEVIHAERSRGGGKPGELLLAARFLDLPGGGRVVLKAMTLGGSGKDNSGGALGVAIVAGPFGMLVRGGELEIPPGTPAQAKLGADLTMPAAMASGTGAPPGDGIDDHAGTEPRAHGADAPGPAGTPQ